MLLQIIRESWHIICNAICKGGSKGAHRNRASQKARLSRYSRNFYFMEQDRLEVKHFDEKESAGNIEDE